MQFETPELKAIYYMLSEYGYEEDFDEYSELYWEGLSLDEIEMRLFSKT